MKRCKSASVGFCPNQRPIPNRRDRLSKKAEAALKKLLTVQWCEFFNYLALNKKPRQVPLKNIRILKGKTHAIKPSAFIILCGSITRLERRQPWPLALKKSRGA